VINEQDSFFLISLALLGKLIKTTITAKNVVGTCFVRDFFGGLGVALGLSTASTTIFVSSS
jgi:hypothetical protein